MQIQIYRSFSCNNSSDFRLVARFSDPKVADYAASELQKLFKEHAKQGDASLDDYFESGGEEWPPEKPTEACESFGKKHGFKWNSWFHWGDDSLEGDEPAAIAADDGTVVIHHTYCGGFPSELKKFFNALGATKVEREAMDSPTVSVLFALPSGPAGKKLAASLTKVFEQGRDPRNEYIDNWKINPPWAKEDQADDESANTAYFCDGKTFGFYIAMEAEHFEKLKKFLAKSGVKNPSIRLCDEGDLTKMKAIGAARCEACANDAAEDPLEYIDPRIHDIKTAQLACKKCGGMYDLATLLTKKPKKAAKKPAAKTSAKSAKKAKTSATAKPLKKKKTGANKK